MHEISLMWIYAFESITYFISALIGLFLGFNFHKMFIFVSDEKYRCVYFGFVFLSLGLFTLSLNNLFNYVVHLQPIVPASQLLELGRVISSFESFSYTLYFGLSILSYALFILAYDEKCIKISKNTAYFIAGVVLFLALFKNVERGLFWNAYELQFHVISSIMLIYLLFRKIVFCGEIKNKNSALVSIGFLFILAFHVFYLLLTLGPIIYLIAHACLLTGFAIFFIVLKRVEKNGWQKNKA